MAFRLLPSSGAHCCWMGILYRSQPVFGWGREGAFDAKASSRILFLIHNAPQMRKEWRFVSFPYLGRIAHGWECCIDPSRFSGGAGGGF